MDRFNQFRVNKQGLAILKSQENVIVLNLRIQLVGHW